LIQRLSSSSLLRKLPIWWRFMNWKARRLEPIATNTTRLSNNTKPATSQGYSPAMTRLFSFLNCPGF